MYENLKIELRKPTHYAKINGKIVSYDSCDTGLWMEPKTQIRGKVLWVYLGCGIIWAINGIRQKGNTAYHFWKFIRLSDLGSVDYPE